MRHLSSIFSFSTLRLGPGLPRATLLALLILLSAEAAVRYRVAQSDSLFGHSFVFQVHRYESLVEAAEYDVWFIGNSTLNAGLDEAVFEEQVGLSAAKMPHGSCSMSGYAELVGYYLRRGPAPDHLVIYVTKDDLNLGGLRAEQTQKYKDYVNETALRPSHWMVLHYDRQELRQAAVDRGDGLYSALRGQAPASEQRFQVEGLDEQTYEPSQDLYEVYNLREAARDWAMDRESVRRIVETAQRYRVQQTSFVLLPCTDDLAALHDRMVPGMPYEQVRLAFRQACKEAGVPCLDLAVASDRHDLFYDAFHMNQRGKQVVTQLVSDWFRLGTPDQPAMDHERFGRLADLVLKEKPLARQPDEDSLLQVE